MRRAEFDQFADAYHAALKKNVALSGEEPAFFAEYKIADASRIASDLSLDVHDILDFGSGIGNSVPWFRKYFSEAQLTCADVSARSMELSRQRFPGAERYAEIRGDALPFPDGAFDLCFTACVFHHIDRDEHRRWLEEMLRVTRPGGMFVIFEHNPWNPLTVRAVNTCPFDANARLISAPAMRRALGEAGWEIRLAWYRLFFPRSLAGLRPLERFLTGVGLGAQYCIAAQRPKA